MLYNRWCFTECNGSQWGESNFWSLLLRLQVIVILQGLIVSHVKEAQNKEIYHVEEVDDSDVMQAKETTMQAHK